MMGRGVFLRISTQILSKWNPGEGCTWDQDTLVPWPLPAAPHLWDEVRMEAKKVCWSETYIPSISHSGDNQACNLTPQAQ